MQLYTGTDIARGAGIFDYVMATELEAPRITPMRSRDAIGIVAAAFASGLNSEQVEAFIEGLHFHAQDHELLKDVLHMYEGSDERLHLWNSKASGAARLSWSLRYYSRPEWRVTSDTQRTIKI